MSASNASTPPVQPGATYRFLVQSTEEAVRVIQERLGENARVLSVRQVGGQGLAGLFSRPKLEVIAQIAPEVTEAPKLDFQSDESASPVAEPAVAGRFVDDSVGAQRSARSGERVDRESSSLGATALRLPELLRKSGFSESILGRLQATPAMKDLDAKPLHVALSEVGRSLRHAVERRPRAALPARTAFLGTPGVGRTTALCKWLARDVFARKNPARVVKAEFDRPNPAEGLTVFCEALGVGMEHYVSADVDAPIGVLPAEGVSLYADLPGLSLRAPGENKAIASFLERERFTGRVLVLNAAYDIPMMRRAYAIGRDLGATHLVLTHMDELEHWGKLWDFLLDGELTPLFLATGPSLTGDCDEDVVGSLMRKTLPGG